MTNREPPDGEGSDPYNLASARNTSTDWLGDMKQVDLNLHGMGDYARNLATIADNLLSHWTGLQGRLTEPMKDAFSTSSFAELLVVGQTHGQNFEEFAKYMFFLSQAITNVSCAAQTIADSYRSTDGWSAVDLNAVQFAFGSSGATKPAGFHPVGGVKTYFNDLLPQQQHDLDQAAQAGAPSFGTPLSNSTAADGTQTLTYDAGNGKVTTVTIGHQDGQTITTTKTDQGTTVVTESSSRYPYGTVKKAVTTYTDASDPKKNTSTTTTTTTYSDSTKKTSSTRTVDNNDKSKPAQTTVQATTYNGDGTTTVAHGTDGNPNHQVSYGPDANVNRTPDDPGRDAQKQLRDQLRGLL